MAASNEDEVIVHPKLPLFRGINKDALEIKAWCEGVERAKEQHGWSEEKTASYAIDALREQASSWQQVTKVENPDGVKTWADLKKLMIAEFSPAQTAAQRIQLVSNRSDSSTESKRETPRVCGMPDGEYQVALPGGATPRNPDWS